MNACRELPRSLPLMSIVSLAAGLLSASATMANVLNTSVSFIAPATNYGTSSKIAASQSFQILLELALA